MTDIIKAEFCVAEKALLDALPESISSVIMEKTKGNMVQRSLASKIENWINMFEDFIAPCMNENGLVDAQKFAEAAASFVPASEFRLADIVNKIAGGFQL